MNLKEKADKFFEYTKKFKCTSYAMVYIKKNNVNLKFTDWTTSYADPGNKFILLGLGSPLDTQLSALVHEVKHLMDGFSIIASWDSLLEMRRRNWDAYVAIQLKREYDAWRIERKALHEIKKLVPLSYTSQKLIEANTPEKLCELILTKVRVYSPNDRKNHLYTSYFRRGAEEAFQRYKELPDHKERVYT